MADVRDILEINNSTPGDNSTVTKEAIVGSNKVILIYVVEKKVIHFTHD